MSVVKGILKGVSLLQRTSVRWSSLGIRDCVHTHTFPVVLGSFCVIISLVEMKTVHQKYRRRRIITFMWDFRKNRDTWGISTNSRVLPARHGSYVEG